MIRSYQNGDEQKIETLFREVFEKERTTKHWNWKFKQNPLNKQIISLFEEGDEIIGHVSLLPHKAKWFDEETTLAMRADTMVSNRHRGKQIYRKLNEHMIEDAAQKQIGFLYGFPAETAKKLFIRYTNAKELTYVPRLIFFQSPSRLLAAKLPLIKPFTILAKPFEKRRNQKWAKYETNEAEIKRIPRCGPEFDELWEVAKEISPILLKRDADYLNWRYHDHPDRDYEMIGYYENQQLKGYAVVHVEKKQYGKSELKFGTLVDVFAINDTKIWKRLIAQAMQLLNRADIVQTWALTHTNFYDTLKELGFIHRGNPMPLVGKLIDEELSPLGDGYDVTNWHITPGDVDSF